MKYSGAILYFLLVAILILFWRKSRGRSLHDLLEQDSHTHHIIQRVMTKHPHGGTWQQYRQWTADEEKQQGK
ncbi:MAG: hypothetical protein WA970_24040 [Gammaproteobacteria bacterium]